MQGDQTVLIEPGDTVDGMIKEHVEHGASHTGAVRQEVFEDPQNADIFENGHSLGGEGLGKPLHMQKSITK